MKHLQFHIDDDESTWIHELARINEALNFIGEQFWEKYDEYPFVFDTARAAICSCINDIVERMEYTELDNMGRPVEINEEEDEEYDKIMANDEESEGGAECAGKEER